MASVEIRDLSFSYSNLKVLDHLSVVLPESKLIGLMGPNASGKSTLLKLIAGILAPASGEIRISGQAASALTLADRARLVAYVPQEFAPAFPFAVFEVALLGRSMMSPHYFYETPEDSRLAAAALNQVGIAHKSSASVLELSGGEKQMLSIARALAQQPRILLLDEPSSFLDIGHRLHLFTLLKSLVRESGVTVLMVSHDLLLAHEFDWIFTMKDRTLFREGAPADVLTVETLQSLYGVPISVQRTAEGVTFHFPPS